MLKKLFSLSIAFTMLLLLTACNNTIKLEQAVIDHNITHQYVPNDHNDVSVNHVSIDINNIALPNLTQKYLDQGLLLLTNSSIERGVYSILEERFIIPFDDVIIIIEPNNANGAYIYVTYPDNEIAVFDITGRELVEKDLYNILNVDGSINFIYGEYDKIIDIEHHETTYILTQEAYDNGIREVTETLYLIDLNSGNRTIIDPESDQYQVGDQLGSETFQSYDLKDYGLDGYTMGLINNTFSVYNKNNELVSQFRNPNLLNMQGRLLFDGKLFYQTKTELPDIEEDYSLIHDGKKYMLKTYAIDLLTSDTTTIEFNYLINSIDPFYDENGYLTLAHANLTEIVDRVLLVETPKNYLIDSQGNLLHYLNVDTMSSYLRLDEQTIFDTRSNTILDNDLNSLYRIPNNSFDYQEKLIVVAQDGLYGVINYQGEVMIPFDYQWIDSQFFNGTTLARTKTGEYVIIDTNGSIAPTIDFYPVFIPGIYISNNGDSIFDIYDYASNKLESITNVSYVTDHYHVNNPFIDADIIAFNADNTYEYVVVRYS